LARLEAFIGGLAQQLGPDAVASRLNIGNYIIRRGTALGIDMDGLVKSEEEVQAEQQQAQIQALVAQLGPNVINQLGAAAREAAAPPKAAGQA
jgi:hypothetical protein